MEILSAVDMKNINELDHENLDELKDDMISDY